MIGDRPGDVDAVFEMPAARRVIRRRYVDGSVNSAGALTAQQ